MKITRHQSLKNYNSFGIDVKAEHFVEATSINDVMEALDFSKNQSQTILGGGSNVLLMNDLPGTCIHVANKGIECISEDDHCYYIKVAAGEIWHHFVLHCIHHNYAGVENLSLIPGSVGAGPMQNIGAYGVELKDVFHELEAFHKHDRCLKTFGLKECEFDYRSSIFKTKLRNEFIILNVTFRLSKKPILNTTYGAINQELEKMKITNPGIKDISDAVIAIRSSKLPNPAEIGNAGSFFKNPTVDTGLYKNLKDKYPDIVAYPQENGKFKLAAGWLIEKAGWKGKRFGNFGVHVNQALVLVNYGGAHGKDIYQLSEDILQDIKHKFGVELEREVNVI